MISTDQRWVIPVLGVLPRMGSASVWSHTAGQASSARRSAADGGGPALPALQEQVEPSPPARARPLARVRVREQRSAWVAPGIIWREQRLSA